MIEAATSPAELFQHASEATTREEFEARAADAVCADLLAAMKASGIPKGEAAMAALKRSGLHKLLVRSLALGRVSHSAVRAELDRMMKALASRTAVAADFKTGILAFDEACQRLALAAGKGGPFRYGTTENRARDSLITFARSLHR